MKNNKLFKLFSYKFLVNISHNPIFKIYQEMLKFIRLSLIRSLYK